MYSQKCTGMFWRQGPPVGFRDKDGRRQRKIVITVEPRAGTSLMLKICLYGFKKLSVFRMSSRSMTDISSSVWKKNIFFWTKFKIKDILELWITVKEG